MNRLLVPALALLALAVTACTAPPDEQEQAVDQAQARAAEEARPAAPAPAVSAEACDDLQAQWAVGAKPTEANIQQVRKDSGADSVRTLKPDQPVTMDFNDRRLNLELDANGVVTSVRCG